MWTSFILWLCIKLVNLMFLSCYSCSMLLILIWVCVFLLKFGFLCYMFIDLCLKIGFLHVWSLFYESDTMRCCSFLLFMLLLMNFLLLLESSADFMFILLWSYVVLLFNSLTVCMWRYRLDCICQGNETLFSKNKKGAWIFLFFFCA